MQDNEMTQGKEFWVQTHGGFAQVFEHGDYELSLVNGVVRVNKGIGLISPAGTMAEILDRAQVAVEARALSGKDNPLPQTVTGSLAGGPFNYHNTPLSSTEQSAIYNKWADIVDDQVAKCKAAQPKPQEAGEYWVEDTGSSSDLSRMMRHGEYCLWLNTDGTGAGPYFRNGSLSDKAPDHQLGHTRFKLACREQVEAHYAGQDHLAAFVKIMDETPVVPMTEEELGQFEEFPTRRNLLVEAKPQEAGEFWEAFPGSRRIWQHDGYVYSQNSDTVAFADEDLGQAYSKDEAQALVEAHIAEQTAVCPTCGGRIPEFCSDSFHAGGEFDTKEEAPAKVVAPWDGAEGIFAEWANHLAARCDALYALATDACKELGKAHVERKALAARCDASDARAGQLDSDITGVIRNFSRVNEEFEKRLWELESYKAHSAKSDSEYWLKMKDAIDAHHARLEALETQVTASNEAKVELADESCDFIDILFATNEKNPDCLFVEVESPPGKGISIGEWVKRGDGYSALRIPKARVELSGSGVSDQNTLREKIAKLLRDCPQYSGGTSDSYTLSYHIVEFTKDHLAQGGGNRE